VKPENSLVPKSAGEAIVDALQSLLGDATDQVLAERGTDSTDGLEAEITQRMLIISENIRGLQRAAQGYVVAYVAREQLWRFHPDGYRNLRQFLRGAGLTENSVTELTALGDTLVPFCDSQEINIDAVLTSERWPKLREAIPALRSAVRDKDPSVVRQILADVKKATTREAVRQKYRRHRDKHGHATTVSLSDGRFLLVAVLDDEDAVRTIVRRLDGGLEWDLVLGANDESGSLRLVLENDGR
jgi:hypothetical protein